MAIVGHGLVSISKFDEPFKAELAGYPVGFTLSLVVLPNGPQIILQVQHDHSLQLLKVGSVARIDLVLKIKHISHAFLLFTMQESTAVAFCNNRMLVDGDVSHAIRMVRLLNRMEVIILPKLIAQMAIKAYPENVPVLDKFNRARRIYTDITTNLVAKALGK